MADRQNNRKVLVVVAAQHPLQNGTIPGPAFAERLRQAGELAKALSETNEVHVYVPGSRHLHDGAADDESLAQAGTTFLAGLGLPRTVTLHGTDLNVRYRGTDGVYNSGDECYVASQFFQDEAFGRLILVTSQTQVTRQALLFTWYGLEAEVHTVPTPDSIHSPVSEAFFQIPVTLANPTTWEPNGELGIKSRTERRPTDGNPID